MHIITILGESIKIPNYDSVIHDVNAFLKEFFKNRYCYSGKGIDVNNKDFFLITIRSDEEYVFIESSIFNRELNKYTHDETAIFLLKDIFNGLEKYLIENDVIKKE